MYLRLKGKLTEKHYTRAALAAVWHCSTMTVSHKLNGNAPIQAEELAAAAKYYELSDAEVLYIIFGAREAARVV